MYSKRLRLLDISVGLFGQTWISWGERLKLRNSQKSTKEEIGVELQSSTDSSHQEFGISPRKYNVVGPSEYL